MTEPEAKTLYEQILRGYLESPEEAYLYQAAQLGRRLLREEAHPEAIVEMHAQAIESITKGLSLAEQLGAARQAFTPLTEMVMAYGLAFRQQLDSQKRYAEQLEERAEEATKELKELLKKIEQAKQEWETTADSLPELICLVDDRGCIVRVNRTVETWDLARVVDVRGREFHELLHPGCAGSPCYLDSFWKGAWGEAIQGQPAQCEAYDPILNRHVLVQIQPWTPPFVQGSRGAGEQGSRGAEERGSRGRFTPAPPHPCTSAPLHLGTPAPRHKGGGVPQWLLCRTSLSASGRRRRRRSSCK